MLAPALVLVGHGSRDPRAAASLAGLAGRVARRVPRAEVRLCFLEHSPPSLEQALEHTEAAVVVPLLLSHGYHAVRDLAPRVRACARGPLALTEPVGPDPLLDDLLVTTAERAAPVVDALVLVGAGSSDAAARDEAARTAGRVSERLGRPVEAAFVAAAPSIEDVVDRLRAHGCDRVGVAPWFLAPGRLVDRAGRSARDVGATVVGGPLGDTAATASIVVARYAARSAAVGARAVGAGDAR